jgi:DNA-binding transcriptional LysR family regulator
MRSWLSPINRRLMVELYQLRYFCAVAQHGSFTAAARGLNVSVQAVSAGVRKLERELRVELFDRTSNPVELTPGGAELIVQARHVVAMVGDLEHHGEEDSPASIVVGTFWGLGAGRLQELAAGLSGGHPPLLDIRVYGWDDPTGGLRGHEVDLAVVPGPSAIDAELRRVTLWYEQRVAIIPASLSAKIGDTITLAELDAIGWVRFPEADPVGHPYWRLDHVRGGPPAESGPVWRTPQEIIVAISQARGTCTTIASFREQFSFPGVALVPIDDIAPVAIDLAQRRDQRNPDASQAFDELTANIGR